MNLPVDREGDSLHADSGKSNCRKKQKQLFLVRIRCDLCDLRNDEIRLKEHCGETCEIQRCRLGVPREMSGKRTKKYNKIMNINEWNTENRASKIGWPYL